MRRLLSRRHLNYPGEAAAASTVVSFVPAAFATYRLVSSTPPTSSSSTAHAHRSGSTPTHGKKSHKRHRPRGTRTRPAEGVAKGGSTAGRHHEASSRRPRSLDIAHEEARVDVERHFPAAIAFLRQPLRSADVADDLNKRRWHDITHDVNVDGAPVPYKRSSADTGDGAAVPGTFFDEGSLDIRGGVQDRAQRAGMDLPTREEALSPDILGLTGGRPSLHGLALAKRSNAAPADETIEGDSSENSFGDTPVELTDMLRERLMELKAERISEERNETFLPRRLQLPTDAQIQCRVVPQKASARTASAQVQLLEHAAKAAQGDRGSSSGDRKLRERTLADVSASQKSLSSSNAAVRDGIDVRVAAPVADLAAAYTPGGLYTEEMDTLLSLDNDKSTFRDSSPLGNVPEETAGCVYLLRLLPRAGFCSRREAVAVIASGQVTVGGVVERNPFRLVRAEEDVHVAGHRSRLRVAPPRLWMYHKPANVIVSRSDPAGRRLITRHANILGFEHLIAVGSLPMRSHGILLLTNDGELSRYLENPQTMIQQTYLLRVRPAIDPSLAQKLNEDGVNINGRQYRQAEFLVNPAMKSRFSVKVKVRGETMPITHLMQHIGRVVERGGRVSFGPFSLGTLAVGSVREVTVPPHYMAHVGALWKPFVERDWPYFRRQRVNRLRRLCRYRELTPKELEELDNFTYEELQDALSLESNELAAAAEARTAQLALAHRTPLGDDALPLDFPAPTAAEYGEDGRGYEWQRQDGVVVEDITRVR